MEKQICRVTSTSEIVFLVFMKFQIITQAFYYHYIKSVNNMCHQERKILMKKQCIGKVNPKCHKTLPVV